MTIALLMTQGVRIFHVGLHNAHFRRRRAMLDVLTEYLCYQTESGNHHKATASWQVCAHTHTHKQLAFGFPRAVPPHACRRAER